MFFDFLRNFEIFLIQRGIKPDIITNVHIFHVKQSHYRPGVGTEGSRKLRFPDFMTTAQVGGKVVSLTHRPSLPPGNAPGTHFC